MNFHPFDEFASAYPRIEANAVLKHTPEDFLVDEQLPFELSGSGEHVWLHIRKRGQNTDWVAKKIAQVAKVRNRNVGYAGLKDRHGETSQWFSVHLPGVADPDWRELEDGSISLLETMRHTRKLKTGALKSNRFTIRLRSIEGDRQLLDERLNVIRSKGVPNYFGEQRFGRGLQNLMEAEQLFTTDNRVPRHKKSIYISAARSWIFNTILSQRIEQGQWDSKLSGDALMLEGKSACFRDDASDEIKERLAKGEIHPTGVLWGTGENMVSDETEALEANIVNRFTIFKEGLESFKVRRMRRALRVFPVGLVWHFEEDNCELSFSLPSGSYATMVLRELATITEDNHVSELS